MARGRRARRRELLARFAAPVAFLLAATIAILLIRAGLRNETGRAPLATLPIEAGTTVSITVTTPKKRRYYTVRFGDTLGTIAERFRTTPHALELLNPGVKATALRPGQKLRVG